MYRRNYFLVAFLLLSFVPGYIQLSGDNVRSTARQQDLQKLGRLLRLMPRLEPIVYDDQDDDWLWRWLATNRKQNQQKRSMGNKIRGDGDGGENEWWFYENRDTRREPIRLGKWIRMKIRDNEEP